jgi:hypothetical protein
MESIRATQFMLCFVSYLSNENGITAPFCSVRLTTQYLFHTESTSNYTLKSPRKKHLLMPREIHFKINLELNGHVIVFDVAANSNLRKL